MNGRKDPKTLPPVAEISTNPQNEHLKQKTKQTIRSTKINHSMLHFNASVQKKIACI